MLDKETDRLLETNFTDFVFSSLMLGVGVCDGDFVEEFGMGVSVEILGDTELDFVGRSIMENVRGSVREGVLLGVSEGVTLGDLLGELDRSLLILGVFVFCMAVAGAAVVGAAVVGAAVLGAAVVGAFVVGPAVVGPFVGIRVTTPFIS
jgi:hypothetical protein